MKRERAKTAKTYVIDKWGKAEDLKAKVYYCVGRSGEFTGRRVFIGECPHDWFFRNGKSRYVAFNLDGSFLTEVDRIEMNDFDVKLSLDEKKYKKLLEERRKLIEDIETSRELQAEYSRRIKQCQL